MVGAVPDFRVARFSGFGAVRVSNSSVTVNLQFNRLYTISFEETGLPNGTAWWVTIEPGTNMSETGLSNGTATVDLQEINNIGPTAEWSYSVSNIPGYWLNHTNGWGGVHIAGANVSVALWFRGTYSVRFTETGLDLESGLSWTVSLQNVTGTEVASSTSDTIVLPDLVGGWAYQVTNVSGYRIEAATGSQFGFVYVNGTTAVSVDFAFLYTITFKETGLPRGTDWTWEVVLGDGTSVQESNSSSGTSLSLLAPDGVWGYVVPEVFVGGVGFRAVGAAHAVDIANANQTVVVSFGQLYPVPPDRIRPDSRDGVERGGRQRLRPRARVLGRAWLDLGQRDERKLWVLCVGGGQQLGQLGTRFPALLLGVERIGRGQHCLSPRL